MKVKSLLLSLLLLLPISFAKPSDAGSYLNWVSLGMLPNNHKVLVGVDVRTFDAEYHHGQVQFLELIILPNKTRIVILKDLDCYKRTIESGEPTIYNGSNLTIIDPAEGDELEFKNFCGLY